MLKNIYKRILQKLNLSHEQLLELKGRLKSGSISIGPFMTGSKMCPNTNALAIKLNRDRFSSNGEVRKLLNGFGISNPELWMFYLLFDLPALFSKNMKDKNLRVLQSAIDEMIL